MIIGCVMAALFTAGTAQAIVRKSTIANGGAVLSGTGIKHRGTLGQAAVGRSAGGGRILGSGLWARGGTAVTGVATTVAGARVLAFGPATPNPTSDETRFALALPNDARVDLRVFDPAGRVVEPSESAALRAGEHVLRWRPAHARAGVYLARVSLDGRVVAVRRFAVIP